MPMSKCLSLNFIITRLHCGMRKDLVIEGRFQIYLWQVIAYVAYSDEIKNGGVQRAKMEVEPMLKGNEKQCIQVLIQIILKEETGEGWEEVDN